MIKFVSWIANDGDKVVVTSGISFVGNRHILVVRVVKQDFCQVCL